jgi:hypothetical protein
VLHQLLVLAAGGFHLSISPDTGAPGAQGLQHGINVVAFYALIACAVGGLASIATWAASWLHVQHLASGGKVGLIVSVIAAFAVGALAALINFFFGIG